MRLARWLSARLTRAYPVLLLFVLVSTAAAPTVVQDKTGRITGHVRDVKGAPLPNVQLIVEGTALTALTDSAGSYLLAAVPEGTVELRAVFIGYISSRAIIKVRAGRTTTHDFTLQPADAQLEEITVTSADSAAVAIQAPTNRAAPRAEAAQRRYDVSGAVQAFPSEPWRRQGEPGNTEAYNRIEDNRFLAALANPLSTFSIDVDAASYSNIRRFLSQGTLPPADAVRLEELVNYFTYTYPDRTGNHPFAVTTDVGPCPWASDHRLVRIGLQAKRVATRDLPPSNLVFLLDVSGSMQSEDKLPLVKQAFRALVQELRPEDRVAIVVYAGAAGLVLPPTSGGDKATILAAIERLEAGGSTAGGAGIKLAYDVARENYLPEGNNRVILATDGDFNVGVSSDAEMIRLVESRREEGTFLTVLGFGTGNLKDSKMEQIADKGNGHYAYIDNFREAHKVFVREFGGTLFTVAKDVKIQVEFNPARVQAYRLLGYENRMLAKEDFADDKKDAGEMGAGHTVTALYEVVPVGAAPVAVASDSLTYQQVTLSTASRSSELLTVKLRYKDPNGTRSRLLSTPVLDQGERGSPDLQFASAVAAFAMVLRNSEYKGQASYDLVLRLAREARGQDQEGYRTEFISMVERARALSAGGETVIRSE
ncbi:MAG TPA: von Willebrand factor type A domain-containing protein [Gemmatimonadales bacterium]|nr:von Willebrand factor type A domain-containing protein [Gemmatimonadales bacterium]